MATSTTRPFSMTASARAVFRRLAQSGPSTRPQLGEALSLSRPTMSAVMGDLEDLGYVEVVGEAQGALGRKAAIYRIGCGAGHVLAIDAGSTSVRLRVATMDRRLLNSRSIDLPTSQAILNEDISEAVSSMVTGALVAAESQWGPLRGIGIALPSRVVGPGGDTTATRQDLVFSRFKPPDVPLILENNVNCAAVAEGLYGAAQGLDTFAYMQFGFKIGMGLMLSGNLVRGSNGAAGEIGHIAFPMSPGARAVAGEIEQYMGADAFLMRVREGWNTTDAGGPPSNPADLLLRAAARDREAMRWMENYAGEIGEIVASIVSVVDPGTVILGGWLGGSELLLPTVSRVANDLSYPVDILTSTLGADATVLGVETLTLAAQITDLLGENPNL